MSVFNLVEVLVALVREGDGNGEDGVGGVLVETRLTVSSEQSQSPAPENTNVNPQT